MHASAPTASMLATYVRLVRVRVRFRVSVRVGVGVRVRGRVRLAREEACECGERLVGGTALERLVAKVRVRDRPSLPNTTQTDTN